MQLLTLITILILAQLRIEHSFLTLLLKLFMITIPLSLSNSSPIRLCRGLELHTTAVLLDTNTTELIISR